MQEMANGQNRKIWNRRLKRKNSKMDNEETKKKNCKIDKGDTKKLIENRKAAKKLRKELSNLFWRSKF